jgi:hypothetical protein
MNAQTTLNKIMTALGMEEHDKGKKDAMKEHKLEDGTKVEAADFSKGQAVFVVTEDKEKMAMPEGSYKMEDGKVMIVDDIGVIKDMIEEAEDRKEEADKHKEKEMDEHKEKEMDKHKEKEMDKHEEKMMEPKKVLESETISRETFFAEMESLKSEFASMKEELANLASQKEQAELQLSATEKDLAEVQAKLNAEPASKGISHSPEGNVEAKAKIRLGKNAPMTTAQRVFERISKIN